MITTAKWLSSLGTKNLLVQICMTVFLLSNSRCGLFALADSSDLGSSEKSTSDNSN